jgi:phosphotransferase system enzyme I (PtsI)
MTPPLLPAVKYLIRAMKFSEAQKLAQDALAQTDSSKTTQLVEAFYQRHVVE